MSLLIGILATWRLSSLATVEAGPFDIFAKFRDAVGVRYDDHSNAYSDNIVGKMLLCFWCTSIWSALIVGLLKGKFDVVTILATSAGSIVLQETMRKCK